jgi:predicted enzyme related to lactoylglutathione lyase
MTTGAPTGITTMATPTDREVAVTRVVAAPRRLVYEAWTQPKHLRRWMLGPEGWTMPEFVYTTFKLGGTYVAGMMPITPQMGKMRPHWGTYFTVSNSDETAREAVQRGGAICVPPRDIPGVGAFAGITSPQGVTIYVIKYSQ